MSYILTLVASNEEQNPVTQDHIARISGHGDERWITQDKAVDIAIPEQWDRARINALRDELDAEKIDVFFTAEQKRVKKLLIADMDSTIVEGETLDDLADFAGLKEQISAITARAMNGELDFEAAIKERVGLLKGLSEAKLAEALDQTKFNAGAESFVRTMKANGAYCVLVSGGFTVFTGPMSQRAGFNAHHGNILGIAEGALDGTVKDPILDKNAKVYFLDLYLKENGLEPAQALTIGDGANDLPMLKAAGLGIGYKPKPVVAAEVDNVIRHGDLTAALYAQGLEPI